MKRNILKGICLRYNYIKKEYASVKRSILKCILFCYAVMFIAAAGMAQGVLAALIAAAFLLWLYEGWHNAEPPKDGLPEAEALFGSIPLGSTLEAVEAKTGALTKEKESSDIVVGYVLAAHGNRIRFTFQEGTLIEKEVRPPTKVRY